MTLKDKETIQRALGIIEGASFGVSSPTADALVIAVEMIDEVLNKEDAT